LERIQEQTEAGSGKQAGSVAISNSKVDQTLGLHLPEWLDQRTALSFIVGASFATLVHYTRISMV
jgi:hypothetical protein